MMAADFFAKRLAVDEWSRRMLFPERSHAINLPRRELGKAKFSIPWIDKELNYEQQVPTPSFQINTRNPSMQSYLIPTGISPSSSPDLQAPAKLKQSSKQSSNSSTTIKYTSWHVPPPTPQQIPSPSVSRVISNQARCIASTTSHEISSAARSPISSVCIPT